MLLVQTISSCCDLSSLLCLYYFTFRMTGASGRKKVFRLADVVQPLSEAQINNLTSKAVKRILHSEKAIAQSGMTHVSDPCHCTFLFTL